MQRGREREKDGVRQGREAEVMRKRFLRGGAIDEDPEEMSWWKCVTTGRRSSTHG